MTSEPYEDLIALALIQEPPHQLRETIDAEQLGELADDIAAHGLLQAIGLRVEAHGASFTIGFGHRRFLATRLLGRDVIRSRVWPAGTDLLEIAVSENHFRKDLNPIEDARAMRAFHERGEPLVHIARRYRCSEGTVRQRLALLDLPEDVQRALAMGTLNVSVAEILGAIDHDEYRRSLIDEAMRTGATARVANVWAAHYASDRSRIVANHLSATAIAESRTAYVVYYPCDACRREVPYEQTRQRRFCAPCTDELSAALIDAQGASSDTHPR